MKISTHYGSKPFGQHVVSKNHNIYSDVTEALGGSDEGMDPHHLLGAALAACTGMTLRMVAQQKNWPLTDVHVTITLKHQDQATHVERSVKLLGPLDETQTQHLLATADKCPIHRLLVGQVTISTHRVQS
jgi:putative redox protein